MVQYSYPNIESKIEVDPGCPTHGIGLLTPAERTALDLTAQLANTLARVVGDGPTRQADLAELVHQVHVIQHAVLAQAAARAYPTEYRLLGEILSP